MSWLVIGTNESANSIRLSGAVDLTGFPSLTVCMANYQSHSDQGPQFSSNGPFPAEIWCPSRKYVLPDILDCLFALNIEPFPLIICIEI
jgi:hypothetical protein